MVSVTLTATPEVGYVFKGWDGDCSGRQLNFSITLDAAKICSATFTAIYTITVNVTGHGKVSSSPAGIQCGNDCTEGYAEGTSITLTAVPDAGYALSTWEGHCSGYMPSVSVLMEETKFCTAVFTSQYSLAITLNGQGRVISTPAGIDCGTDCIESYSGATQVTLTAETAANFLFNGWGGDCAGQSSSAVLQVDAAKNCVAQFLALTCEPVVYSLKTQQLTLSQLAIEMYFPFTDHPNSQYALCGGQGTQPLTLKYKSNQEGFIFQPHQAIACATQFIAPQEFPCFSVYSAQRQTLTLPNVKVIPQEVIFPGDKALKHAACYRATLVQGTQAITDVIRPGVLVDSKLFTLVSAEEMVCW